MMRVPCRCGVDRGGRRVPWKAVIVVVYGDGLYAVCVGLTVMLSGLLQTKGINFRRAAA